MKQNDRQLQRTVIAQCFYQSVGDLQWQTLHNLLNTFTNVYAMWPSSYCSTVNINGLTVDRKRAIMYFVWRPLVMGNTRKPMTFWQFFYLISITDSQVSRDLT